MKTKMLATVAGAAALALTPVVAQAAAAERTPSPVEEKENMRGSGWVIAVLAIAAIIAGIIIAAGGDDDELPTSP